jgi:hypothetical protein
MTDVDFDGFDWGDSPEAFRWNNNRQRFKDLEGFAEAIGIEQHAIRVRKRQIFATWDIPNEPSRVSPQHLPLKTECNAVDAGVVVPNISDEFKGNAPDLGAYEFGGEMPHYGPRRQ